jgi:DNA-3-methyladenine glycosylase II
VSEAHEELAALDPKLARLIESTDPKEVLGRVVERDRDRFVALCRIIVGQQVSTAAARTIWGRVEEAFDGPPKPEQLLEPDAEKRLRTCGLSGRKASYAIGIAEAIVAEELLLDGFDSMSDDEVLDAIVALRGLGQWSAEMFLIFDLGRPDVFSGGDLGLRRGIQIAYELDEMPSPEEAVAIAERWSPHRSLACLYLWEAVHANPR